MTDRGYLNLLSHLARSSTTLPLSTIQGSVAHYLAHINPSPTPLAATVVGSPFFRRASHIKLDGLATAFRHGVHLKMKVLKDEPGGVFTRRLGARLADWVAEVLKGLQGGFSLLRLTCYTGLLQGLGDWEHELKAKDGQMRRGVEEELVVALAEVMDQFTPDTSTGWEKEFKVESQVETEEGMLQLTFLITARSLSLVALDRLRALPLAALIRLLLSVVDDAFQGGTFLRELISENAVILPDSAGATNIRTLSKSLLMSNMGPLSGMCSQLLSVLADTRPVEAWSVMLETAEMFTTITKMVEEDWLKIPFSRITNDEELELRSRELATTTWLVLKTLLFTTIRVTQSLLTVVVYTPQPLRPRRTSSRPTTPSTSPPLATPFTFALSTLNILSNIAFTLPQFGGVSSTASDGGFVELKKVFYTALDVLSADELESARFVHELRESTEHNQVQNQNQRQGWPSTFWFAKKAYALACVEQLVKVLNEDSIRNDVYPLVAPHLEDLAHRETFESAHSVMLAIFAAHALKAEKLAANDLRRQTGGDSKEDGTRPQPFAEQVVPFYTQCLVDNSSPTRLNRTQLRLASRALVRSASTMRDGDVFAWYCIDALLRASRSLDHSADKEYRERRQSLRLATIATVSSVSLTVLERVLGAILEEIYDDTGVGSSPGDRELERSESEELVNALFEEISERVGDEGKEFAMRWWNQNKRRMKEAITGHNVSAGPDDVDVDSRLLVKGKGKERETVSRL
ncbi:hypothetical protein BDW22DRAFT_1353428 [Trametopsis cervina]|nr:hypothetical protein BDW22DRAFT_1353428 [Trametopsis cervina]